MVTKNRKKRISPWGWIPTLYIAEGLPYFAVNTLTVLMYTNLGVSKTDMAFFTGWLYLPWVIKPFWSPFVDIFRTKRWWILAMQLLIAIAMAGVAFSLTVSCFFAFSLAVFWIMAFASATHDISADGYYILALDEEQQAAFVGVRSTFYRIASILGQGGVVILAGYLEESLHSVSAGWSVTFILLSVLFALIFFYHLKVLPSPVCDDVTEKVKAGNIVRDFINAFVTFFKKPNIISALLFMLLYRLPEAFCVKMIQPFMKDPVADGGLGMSTQEIGFVNGTVGVIALLAGGITGGIVIAKSGLKRWLWPMALSLGLPCIVYCYLAALQPADTLLISILIGIEQFGYGFGFTAYMMYLMYFSRGENATSHYAFCTAFMALGMMIPGMAAGWLFDTFAKSTLPVFSGFGAYDLFFSLVMLSTLATFAVTARIYKLTPRKEA
ncbi:MAG: MFS transporter [Muribaculaceae bacterium]|nr:MFS transporter [Muribaculaceae bacterium]